MSTVRLSDLPPVITPADADLFETTQDGETRSETRGQIVADVASALSVHQTDSENPHGVTAAQIGAALDLGQPRFVVFAQTASAAQTEMLGAGGAHMVLADTTSWAFRALTVARGTAGESRAWDIRGLIRRGTGAASVSLVAFNFDASPLGTPLAVFDAGQDADTLSWAVAVDADPDNGALRFRVTGEAGKTIRWAAQVDAVAVSG